MLFHPLQAFARINWERARRFLGASPVGLSGGRAHGVREPSPGVLLAGFGRDARLEIGELRYGGAARVSLREDASDWIVTVADDGPGIPPESFDSAFEPFQRLESSRNRETGGAGLGLSIARDIVLAHGGRISLANASVGSGGLVVSVLLPKALAASG